MRNLKKFLALVLATMMLLSVVVISTSAAAKDEYDYTGAAERLAALQVMKGNENGDLMLDSEVTRYQAALFFVQALTGETETATWQTTKNSAYFSDVVDYGTAIDYAYGINIVKGRGNGIYGYNDAIMYQDMLVMAVRALGYETPDMSYPYGYILAAQKLGLTENIEKADYKAALTRGETAQIIWDMLDTTMALVDPITDKILYPDEFGLTDALLDAGDVPAYQRPTLMEESELVLDRTAAYVLEYLEAEDDDEEDLLRVYFRGGNVVEIAAEDFGIDADTPAVDYLGLPVFAYLDQKAQYFDQNEYDRDQAHILFTVTPEYENVMNLGDGNVKYTVNKKDVQRSYVTFGEEKFTAGRYQFEFYTFGENGWFPWIEWRETEDVDRSYITEVVGKKDGLYPDTTADMREILYFSGFEYEDGEYVVDEDEDPDNGIIRNAFGEFSFYETDYYTWDELNEEWDTVVYVLFTPFTFGQYNVRELKDRANSSKLTDFATISYYGERAYENYDGDMTNFHEVLVGSWELDEFVEDGVEVSSKTSSVSAKNGENAKNVTLAGEDVEAGDFVFYAYNGIDNILTIAKNCGTFETGRLTARNTNKETVKIDGTNYEFGFVAPAFAPSFDVDNWKNFMPSTWEDFAGTNNDLIYENYIKNLEAGEDNVKYLVVDDRIVYMEPCSATHSASTYDFVVISLDAERIAEVLSVSDRKYENNLTGEVVTADNADFTTDGYYIDDNGYVAVAVLSQKTGEWELGYIKAVVADYNLEEEEFETSYDLATLATYTDLFEVAGDYKRIGDYKAAYETITHPVGTDIVLAAVEVEDDNVYTVAAPAYTYEEGGVTYTDSFLVTGDFATCADAECPKTDAHSHFAPVNEGILCEGLAFSNNNAKTNAITADNDVEAARVTLDEETVIIVYNAVKGVAGARVGVQTKDNNYTTANGGFLAASADLIALVDLDGTMVMDDWADNVAAKYQTWYMRTADTSVEVENVVKEDDIELYSVTITNVIDMKTLEVVESVTYEVEEIDDDLIEFAMPGCEYDVLHKAAKSLKVDKRDLSVIVVDVANALDNNYEYVGVDPSEIEFVDGDSINIEALEKCTCDGDVHKTEHKKVGEAVEINATVVTVNLVQDAEDYDFSEAILPIPYDEDEDIWDIGCTNVTFVNPDAFNDLIDGIPVYEVEEEVEFWSYPIDGEMVEEVNEPTEGILDSYILYLGNGTPIVVPEVDGDLGDDDIIFADVNVYVAAAFDDGVVYLTVFKVIEQ